MTVKSLSPNTTKQDAVRMVNVAADQAFATRGNPRSATWNAPSRQYQPTASLLNFLRVARSKEKKWRWGEFFKIFLVSGHFYSIRLYWPKHQTEELQFSTVVDNISSHWVAFCGQISENLGHLRAQFHDMIGPLLWKEFYFPITNRLGFELVSSSIIIDHE